MLAGEAEMLAAVGAVRSVTVKFELRERTFPLLSLPNTVMFHSPKTAVSFTRKL